MTTIQTTHHALATATPGKALNVALWTLQVLVALRSSPRGPESSWGPQT